MAFESLRAIAPSPSRGRGLRQPEAGPMAHGRTTFGADLSRTYQRREFRVDAAFDRPLSRLEGGDAHGRSPLRFGRGEVRPVRTCRLQVAVLLNAGSRVLRGSEQPHFRPALQSRIAARPIGQRPPADRLPRRAGPPADTHLRRTHVQQNVDRCGPPGGNPGCGREREPGRGV